MLPVFHVGFLVEYLDKVEVAIVRLLQLVLLKLNVDVLLMLGAYDPSTIQGNSILFGVVDMLFRYVGSTY